MERISFGRRLQLSRQVPATGRREGDRNSGGKTGTIPFFARIESYFFLFTFLVVKEGGSSLEWKKGSISSPMERRIVLYVRGERTISESWGGQRAAIWKTRIAKMCVKISCLKTHAVKLTKRKVTFPLTHWTHHPWTRHPRRKIFVIQTGPKWTICAVRKFRRREIWIQFGVIASAFIVSGYLYRFNKFVSNCTYFSGRDDGKRRACFSNNRFFFFFFLP